MERSNDMANKASGNGKNGNGDAGPGPLPGLGGVLDSDAQPKPQPAAPAGKPTVSHMFGEVTWLLTQSAQHKHFALSDLEWMVMPAILLEQFRVFRDPQGTPAGVAFWAYLTEDAEKRLEAQPGRLRPDEWKGGDRLWLINLVSPFATPENKMVDMMIGDLLTNVFPKDKIKFHKVDQAAGTREVVELYGPDLAAS